MAAGAASPSGLAPVARYAAGAVLGALAAVFLHPVIGLPVAGAALAGLAFRAPAVASAGVAVIAGSAVGLLAGAGDAITIVLPMVGVALPLRAPYVFAGLTAASLVLVGPVAAQSMRRRGSVGTAVGVTVGLSAAQLAALALIASGAGRPLGEFVGYVVDGLVGVLSQGGAADASVSLIAESREAIVALWPSLMVVTNGLVALGVVIAVGMVAKRIGVSLGPVPQLAQFDLSPWVVLAPILALALLAAERLAIDGAPVLGVIGLNVLSVARWVFFLQGMAVFAALFGRLKTGRPARIFGYVLLGIAESQLWLGSVLGLADIWLNLRRLPRDGARPEPIEAPSGTD